MRATTFWMVTAVVEVGAGICFLILPTTGFDLLLGVNQTPPEGTLVGRVLGAALLAISVACWAGRNDTGSPTRRGLLIGLLVYNAAVASLLVYAAVALSLRGIALWPAVVLHTLLGGWCVIGLRIKPGNVN